MENIKLNGYSLNNEEDTKYIHAQMNYGDHTLCGNGDAEYWELVNEKINCPNCIAIIEHCKSFKKNKDYELSQKHL